MNTRYTISQNIVNSILLEVKKLSEAKSSDEVNKYLDQFRSKWKGCGSPSPYVNLYQFGVLDTPPEFGYAEFDGVIDGKNIKVKACFDSYKLIRTIDGSETGDRGTFEGEYYSDSAPLSTPRPFKGDDSKANKFQYGTLQDTDDYSFYTDNWKYAGNFIDGRIGGNGQIIFLDTKDSYKGQFKNGVIDGSGEYFSASTGKKIKGVFKQNDGIISVTTDDGKFIRNIYDSAITSNPIVNKDSLTINVRKSANLEGVTNFKSTITQGDVTKTFEGTIPNVTVKLVRVDNKKDIKLGKSDKNGNFIIKDINLGVYNLSAVILNDENSFSLKLDNLKIDEDYEFVNLILTPNKSVKRSERTTIDFNSIDISKKQYNSTWYKNLFVPSGDNTKPVNKKSPDSLEEDCLIKLKEYGNDLKVMHQTGKFPTTLGILDQEKKINFSDLKNSKELVDVKNQLQFCWNTFKNARGFRRKVGEKNILLMRNPVGQFLDFQLILPEHFNKQDIYNKKVMELSKTIHKVVLEHKQKKYDSLSESKIVFNRLNFIVENSTNRTHKNIQSSLIKEKNRMIDFGYNEIIVNEQFKRVINEL
jgi:hypothetical protein